MQLVHQSLLILTGWTVEVVAGIYRTEDFRDYRQLLVKALILRVKKEGLRWPN